MDERLLLSHEEEDINDRVTKDNSLRACPIESVESCLKSCARRIACSMHEALINALS